MKNYAMLEMLEGFISSCKVCTIGSVDSLGVPYIKAVLPPRERVGITTFYFTTNTSSMRAAQFKRNPKACIYFFERQTFKGLLLLGKMEVLSDAVIKEKVWREGDTVYYKEGAADPDYSVLKFTAEVGRYYSNLSSEDFKVE